MKGDGCLQNLRSTLLNYHNCIAIITLKRFKLGILIDNSKIKCFAKIKPKHIFRQTFNTRSTPSTGTLLNQRCFKRFLMPEEPFLVSQKTINGKVLIKNTFYNKKMCFMAQFSQKWFLYGWSSQPFWLQCPILLIEPQHFYPKKYFWA